MVGWIPSKNGFRKPFSPILNPNLMVKDLLDNNKTGTLKKLRNILVMVCGHYDVSKIYITSHSWEDKRIWSHPKNGETKSTFRIIRNSEPNT